MEINSITYLGWQGDLRTIEKRINYDYPNGNDVVVVERRYYPTTVYDINGTIDIITKGSNIDKTI